MYVCLVKQPDIMQKDLADTIQVSRCVARQMRKKASKLEKHSLERRLLKRFEGLIQDNYWSIFADNLKFKVEKSNL